VSGRANAPRPALGGCGKGKERVCGIADAAASRCTGNVEGIGGDLRRSAATGAAGTAASLAAWLAAGAHSAFAGVDSAGRGACGDGVAILGNQEFTQRPQRA